MTKLTTIHSPNGQEFGKVPTEKPAMIRTILHSSQEGEVPVYGKAPLDLFEVCPNMPTVAKGSDKDGPFWVIDCTKGDLAAWKATRTKRLPSRASEGRLQLDARVAADPVDPKLSASANQAWVTRRAAAAEKAKASKTA